MWATGTYKVIPCRFTVHDTCHVKQVRVTILARGVLHITIVESQIKLAISMMLCIIEQHCGRQEPALYACQLIPFALSKSRQIM